MTELFKNFSFQEISDWINDTKNFFFHPNRTISNILSRTPEEIFRQFLFFFLVYTGSYVFLSLGTSLSEWLRPAVINIFTLVPIAILFLISTSIFTGKSYDKHILVFLLGLQFLVTPILIIIYATFLTSENYTYKFMADIFSACIMVYVIFVLGFAIEANRAMAVKLTLWNYVVVNLVFFFFQRVDVDPYSSSNFTNNDPIYQEYYLMVKPLKYKDQIPTSRVIMVYGDKIHTSFGTQDVVTETVSSGRNELNALYIKSVNENIAHIESRFNELKFGRNKENALIWLDYLRDIKAEAEFKVKDTFEIKALQLKQIDSLYFNKLGVKAYFSNTNIDKLLQNQIPLKWYNNSIVNNYKNSTATSRIVHDVIFIPGYTLDYLIGDLLLKESEPKPFNDIFIELE